MNIDRKHDLLHQLIHEHIATGTPVGSLALAHKTENKFSPATIRNDMSELERDGLITHPHTSAGRIPTAKGWRYYIDNILREKQPTTKEQKELSANAKGEHEEALKQLSRTLAAMSRNASFIGFSPDDVYYTGLSHLFSEPEFENLDLVRRMSEVVDHLDEVMRALFKQADTGVHILVGEENPFGEECGVIFSKYERRGKPELYGILGPMRMQYDKNLGYVHFTNTILLA